MVYPVLHSGDFHGAVVTEPAAVLSLVSGHLDVYGELFAHLDIELPDVVTEDVEHADLRFFPSGDLEDTVLYFPVMSVLVALTNGAHFCNLTCYNHN